MTDASLSADLVARLHERAQDPVRRTSGAALVAGAVPLGDLLAAERARLAAQPEDLQRGVAEYLEGVNSPFSQLMGNLGSLGGLVGAPASAPAPTAAPAPASEAQVAAVEADLGFALPPDLRDFYLEVADGGVGPGDGIYSLAELLAKHRELTGEPVGPQGQDWPTSLLPIQCDDWDLVSIDRDTGRLVYWDLEELDDDDELSPDDNPTWAASFVPEADSLGAWLTAWLA
jgi:hypothetical protein